jgi:hypothetical protein
MSFQTTFPQPFFGQGRTKSGTVYIGLVHNYRFNCSKDPEIVLFLLKQASNDHPIIISAPFT